jgi:hypothetical protein
MVEVVQTATNEAYEQVVNIPSGVMDLVRKSYDTRDKVFDWLLAIGVTGTLVYVFWDQICGLLPSAIGKYDIMPNQDVTGALGKTPCQPVSNIYTYNMPPARKNIADRIGPASVRVPYNPGTGPQFSADDQENEG